MNRKLPYFVVNAFADKPFTGNGAAVCWVERKSLSKELMQSVASEINLSETCFIYEKDGKFKDASLFGLRWFTPTNEVPLCGHATLASAATLFYKASNHNEKISFDTASGILFARKNKDYITLDFPRNDPEPIAAAEQCQPTLEVLFAGTSYQSQVENIEISHTAKKLVVQMNKNFSRIELESLAPNTSQLKITHDGSLFKGVIVTARGEGKYDFISRYFAPWNGIPEDPVTGSAHTVLAPYWSKILGKDEMNARQCSKRGGDIRVKLRDDGRVDLNGFATTVIEGKLTVPEE